MKKTVIIIKKDKESIYMKNTFLAALIIIISFYACNSTKSSPHTEETTPSSISEQFDLEKDINNNILSLIGMTFKDIKEKFGKVVETNPWGSPYLRHKHSALWFGYGDGDYEPGNNAMVNIINCSISDLFLTQNISEKNFVGISEKVDYGGSVVAEFFFKYNGLDLQILVYYNSDGTIDGTSQVSIMNTRQSIKIDNHWYGHYTLSIDYGKLDEFSSMFISYDIIINQDSCIFLGAGYQTYFTDLCKIQEDKNELRLLYLSSIDGDGFTNHSDIDIIATLIKNGQQYYITSPIIADKNWEYNHKILLNKIK